MLVYRKEFTFIVFSFICKIGANINLCLLSSLRLGAVSIAMQDKNVRNTLKSTNPNKFGPEGKIIQGED